MASGIYLVYKINIYLPNLKSRYHDNNIAFLKWKVQNISGYCDALVERVV